MRDLVRSAGVPVYTVKRYVRHRLLAPVPFYGTATRYPRDYLVRLLALRFWRGDGKQDAHQVAAALYVAGGTGDTLPGQTRGGDYDGFVRRYDASGTESWTHQLGTVSNDEARAVAVDSTGGVYVAGVTNGAFPGQANVGGTDGFLRHYDRAGVELWTRQFGTSGNDDIYSVTVDAAGSIYVSGSTQGSFAGQAGFGGTDGFVVKFVP